MLIENQQPKQAKCDTFW